MTEPIGPQRPNDPRGWLRFQSLPADLQRHEDSRQEADQRLYRDGERSRFQRPATDTERTLLEHLGYRCPPDLHTTVIWLSPGVRRREWPQLVPAHTGHGEAEE